MSITRDICYIGRYELVVASITGVLSFDRIMAINVVLC
jgi:hypothetical protein